MQPQKRVLTVVLALALGLGVWAASFSYQAATFADGEILSAAALNDLLNDNFQAASDAVDERVHKDGDTMSGPLVITADAIPLSQGALATTLGAVNPHDEGYAAMFQATHEDNDAAAVGILNAGGGPALLIKSTGAGPLINANGVFEVLNTGSIRLGGSTNAKLVLDAEDGTITNAVGSGLPLAFGRVASNGSKSHGTDNWTSSYNNVAERYEITIDGVPFSHTARHAATITTGGSTPRFTGLDTVGGDMLVFIRNSAGDLTQSSFTFVVYESP